MTNPLLSEPEHDEIRCHLIEIGARRRAFKQMRMEAARIADEWIPRAVDAGIPITEISRIAGFARPAIYTILEKHGRA